MIILFLQVSCKKGEYASGVEITLLTFSNIQVADYNSTHVSIRVIGGYAQGVVADVELIDFFSEAGCTNGLVGTGLAQDYGNNGVFLSIPANQTISLYAKTRSHSSCIFLTDYTNPLLQPSTPVFTQVSPPTPSRDSHSPGVFGTVTPISSTVELFSDASCTQFLAQDSAMTFAQLGIQVNLPANATTTVYARARDPYNTVSSCAEMIAYTHSDLLSDPPVLLSMTPLSPSNTSFSPRLRGTTDPNAVTISLYKDSGCRDRLVEGTPAAFSSAGLGVTAVENGTMSIYGQSIDHLGNPSVCALLTVFKHDGLPPTTPVFSHTDPVSPTNQTTLPKIIGTSSFDTESIYFYDSSLCLNIIGSGNKNDFENAGISVSVKENDTTNVYARAFDSALNGSTCTLFVNYVHNTAAPLAPTFQSTIPQSPTNTSITPLVIGEVAPRTVAINMYKDEMCTLPIGNGTTAEFEGAGVQVSVDANATTSIYTTVRDIEGNVSECYYLASYAHSNVTAPSPGFFGTFPPSPTNASNTPAVIGTADSTLATIAIFSDNICTMQLGSGTRGQYTSSGVAITVPQNSTNNLYARGQDIYGNYSLCVLLTQYIHNTVPPHDPTYTSTDPVSPNNHSTTPMIFGQVLHNMASQLLPTRVVFYDSPSCVSNLGEGTPEEFNTTGIQINVAQNALTSVYSRSFDAAGNMSECVLLTNYTHNNHVPGMPILSSTTPGTPSYSPDVRLFGSYSTSPDFMNRVNLSIYSNSNCTNLVTNGSPSLFQTTGFPVTVNLNTTMTLYGQSTNEVGTRSNCSLLTTFRHYDLAPQSINIFNNVDGSLLVSWLPDSVSKPTPTYSVERSLSAAGPFTVISSSQIGNTFRDSSVSNNKTYYYRVFASNTTGRSQYSATVNATTSAPTPIQAANLNALGGDSKIRLTWGGFPQNMSYKIFRSVQRGGPFIDLGITTTTTVYNDSGLTNNQEYHYIIKASNPAGQTIQSNVASAVPRVLSDAPMNLIMTPHATLSECGGSRGIQLAWTAPSYFDDFKIYRGTSKSTTNAVQTVTPRNTTHCEIDNNNLYFYRIAATWDDNFSQASNVVGFYNANTPTLNVFPGNNEMVLSWNAPTPPSSLSAYPIQYDVFKALSYNGDYQKVADGITTLSYSEAVINGSGGFYFVQPFIIDNQGDRSYIGYPTSKVSASTYSNPNAPSHLILTEIPEEGRVQLSWAPPSHYNGFNIYRASSVGGPYSRVLYTRNTVVLSAPLIPGENYFKVTAAWGGHETAETNTVFFRSGPIIGLNLTETNDDLRLTWSSVLTAFDYVVYRSTNINGPYVPYDSTTTASYIDTAADAGTGYYYKVRARFSGSTEGQLSNAVSGMRRGTSVPSNISLTVLGTTSLKVDWPRVNNALSYQVFSSTSISGPYVSRGTTATNSLNIFSLSPNTQYFVKVVATVGVTTFESLPVSARTYAVPQAPNIQLGNNELNIIWSPVSGVVDYQVLRSPDGINFTSLVSGYGSTNYLDTTVTNGEIYFYRIVANYGPEQISSPSSLAGVPGRTPLAPSNLMAENNGTGTEVNLSWTGVSGNTSYNIYMSTSSGSYSPVPTQNSTTANGTRVAGLTNGTTYYFVVRAVNGTQLSPQSNEIVIIPELDPAKPTAQFYNASSVNVTWTSIAGVSTYDLYRSVDGRNFSRVAQGLGSPSFIDSTVNSSLTYYYRYQGLAASGARRAMSDISDPVNISIAPVTPLGFYAELGAGNSVNLRWTLVPSISRYEILRGSTTGGPYSVINSTAANVVTYTDNSVSAGQSYYYVVRSVNSSGVVSLNSAERSVSLVNGPTSLVATGNQNGIQLSWNSVAGVVSYNVRRSEVSGGPYGTITNLNALNYLDTNVVVNKSYYYVVEGVYADGRKTRLSNEASVLSVGAISIQVPIELTDMKLGSSSTGAVVFQRTQTSFNLQDYDGVTSVELEVIATNNDTVTHSVSLVDSLGIVTTSINIPPNIYNPTRIRSTVTLPNVADVYRIRLESSNFDNEVSVYAARLLINQSNPTKTKLYFPLLTTSSSPSSSDGDVNVYSTSDNIYQDYYQSMFFERQATKLRKITDYNAWELEVLVYTTGAAQGILGLQNINNNQIVGTTETRFVTHEATLASIPFNEGVSSFATANENHRYRLAVRCEFNCQTGVVAVQKAGLWVRLENLSRASLIFRMNQAFSDITSPIDLVTERVFMDLSKFSSPRVYMQALLEDNFSSSGHIELISSPDNSGDLNLLPVAGSDILVDANSVALYTSGLLSITSGHNYMIRVSPDSGSLHLRNSQLRIEVGQ